jgi:hypothetical protein
MVDMAGNNSLSDAAGIDLDEMRKVGSTNNVKMLAFIAQSRLSGTAQRLQVEKNGTGEQIETLQHVDSGDPQTVIDFLRWGLAHAPAERYAIVLWYHGGGWTPDDLEQLCSQVRGVRDANGRMGLGRREMNHRANQSIAHAFFTRSVRKVLTLPTENERAICSDDGSGHSLDTIELGGLLKLATQEIGQKIEQLGMDACLMSTLEVAYEVQGEVRVVVGSKELEPAAGSDYSTLLHDLTQKPGMDGQELGRQAVTRCIESYQYLRRQWPVTQCAIDASHIEAFSRTIDALERALHPQLSAYWPKVLSAQRASVSFGNQFRLTDLASFCRNLLAAPLGAEVQNAAHAVLEALQPGSYVIAEAHLGAEVDGCGGVSVYMPGPMEHISPCYKDLGFAKQHAWDQFLQAYHDAV